MTEVPSLPSTAYDDLEELLTGDNFNFLPPAESVINFFPIGGIAIGLTGDAFADLSQTQYLETDSVSQEFRYTSSASERMRWIVGAYAISTDRYISTGNQIDRDQGVLPPSIKCLGYHCLLTPLIQARN